MNLRMKSTRPVVPEKNELSATIKNNCCDYNAQIAAYQRWAQQGERRKVIRVYENFVRHLRLIFATFAKVEKIAKNTRKRLRG